MTYIFKAFLNFIGLGVTDEEPVIHGQVEASSKKEARAKALEEAKKQETKIFKVSSLEVKKKP